MQLMARARCLCPRLIDHFCALAIFSKLVKVEPCHALLLHNAINCDPFLFPVLHTPPTHLSMQCHMHAHNLWADKLCLLHAATRRRPSALAGRILFEAAAAALSGSTVEAHRAGAGAMTGADKGSSPYPGAGAGAMSCMSSIAGTSAASGAAAGTESSSSWR